MIAPPMPANEKERQQAIEKYKILDSMPEGSYDDITSLMAMVCDVPISMISLIDNNRQWFKSHHGVDIKETPRNLSFCGHAILNQEDIFVVEDARDDERFFDNPLVTKNGIVGYAGVPLIDRDNYALGTLCIVSNQPMILSEVKRNALKAMARQVMYLLERHLREKTLEEVNAKMEAKNKELTQYAGILSHDMKAPVNHIIGYLGVIEEDVKGILTGEMLDCFEQVTKSARVLSNYIDSLLKYYTDGALLVSKSKIYDVADVLNDLSKLVPINSTTTLELPDTDLTIHTNRAALTQILLNLITNAIKYGNKEHTNIKVTFHKTDTHNHFSVIDNGIGIDPKYHKTIFNLFSKIDNSSDVGTGIGLAAVRNLVTSLGGDIRVESELGKGSKFTVMLPRANSQDIQLQ